MFPFFTPWKHQKTFGQVFWCFKIFHVFRWYKTGTLTRNGLIHKQLFADVLQNICFLKFRTIHRKTHLLETVTQVFSYECCEIFKNSFFYRTPPVAASVSIINHSSVKKIKPYLIVLKTNILETIKKDCVWELLSSEPEIFSEQQFMVSVITFKRNRVKVVDFSMTNFFLLRNSQRNMG